MITNYFTFGCGQTFAEHHVTITARNTARCLEIMFQTFGEKWSMQYPTDPSDEKRYPTKELINITESEDGARYTQVQQAEILIK